MNEVNSVKSNNNKLEKVVAEYIYFSDDSQGYFPAHQINNGISIVGNGNEIKDSTIAYSTGTLIRIAGNDNRIVNNNIHDGNYMGSYASLINLESGERNLISHNTLSDAGRANVFWSKSSAVVQYNDIKNGMWLTNDGGMIYTWGSDLGNSEIHHNLIHDNKAEELSYNLYLDNFTENAVIHHNVIYNGSHGIQLNTPGHYRLVYNNTVVNTDQSIGFGGVEPYDQESYGTRVFDNIFTDAVRVTADSENYYNITSYDEAGLNFMNAGGNDYRLSTGSIAIDQGALLPGINHHCLFDRHFN